MLVLVQGGLYKALKLQMLQKCWVNLSAGKCNFKPGCRHSCGTQLSGWGQSQEKMVSEAFRSVPLLYYMRTSDSSEVWATCCSLLYWIKSVTHRVLNLGLHLLWKCKVWSVPLQSVRRCQHSRQSLQHPWTALNAASSAAQPSPTSTQPVFQPACQKKQMATEEQNYSQTMNHSVFSNTAQMILMRFLQRATVDTSCFYKEPCNLRHLNFNYPISLVPGKAMHGNYTESYFSNSIIQISPSFS